MRRCVALVIGLLCLFGCLLFVDAHAKSPKTAPATDAHSNLNYHKLPASDFEQSFKAMLR